jgi:hypothetical protein
VVWKEGNMKAAALVLGLACAAAHGQVSATLTWHWRNMTTGAQTPLPPGDSAAIWLDVAFSPPVGSVFPNGQVNRGLASVVVDLHAISDVFGTWVVTGAGSTPFPGTPEIDGPGTNVPIGWQPGDPVVPLHWGRRHDPLRPGSAWGWGGDAWYLPQGGFMISPGTLTNIQGGQFPPTTETNSANPVFEFWRGMFTPDSYAARGLEWGPGMPIPGPFSGSVVTLLAQSAPGGPLTVFHVPIQHTNFGTLSIPVVPAPSSLAMLGVAGALALRRQRREKAV